MQTGTVKFFNESKGYGFIKEDLSNQEIFVHITGLVDQVRENDKVAFDKID
jgi:CspA family cold shock protein